MQRLTLEREKLKEVIAERTDYVEQLKLEADQAAEEEQLGDGTGDEELAELLFIVSASPHKRAKPSQTAYQAQPAQPPQPVNPAQWQQPSQPPQV